MTDLNIEGNMTEDEFNAIKARLEAALKCDDWGTHGAKLDFTPEKVGRNASIWYGDGDQCAEIHGNLGLGIDGDAVGRFFAGSIDDMKAMVADRDALILQNKDLRILALRMCPTSMIPCHLPSCQFCGGPETDKPKLEPTGTAAQVIVSSGKSMITCRYCGVDWIEGHECREKRKEDSPKCKCGVGDEKNLPYHHHTECPAFGVS